MNIFPNVKTLSLYSTNFEGAWPSTHYTNLRLFNTNDEALSGVDSKVIPLSLNGYQELICKPEAMIRGIKDAKF